MFPEIDQKLSDDGCDSTFQDPNPKPQMPCRPAKRKSHVWHIYIYIIISYYIISYYNILYYSIVYYIILCYIILYYMILCYIILYYVILYYIIVYIPYIYTIYIYTHTYHPQFMAKSTRKRSTYIIYIQFSNVTSPMIIKSFDSTRLIHKINIYIYVY